MFYNPNTFDSKEKICYNCIYYIENDSGIYFCELFNTMPYERKVACEKFRSDYNIDDEINDDD